MEIPLQVHKGAYESSHWAPLKKLEHTVRQTTLLNAVHNEEPHFTSKRLDFTDSSASWKAWFGTLALSAVLSCKGNPE